MARALFVLLCAVVASTAYFFSRTWLPALASPDGGVVDYQLTLNFVLLGMVFCSTQLALGLFLWKYRASSGARVVIHSGPPSARVELTWLTLAAVLFLGLNIVGTIFSLSIHPGKKRIRVEITGAQFRWYFRYAGQDDIFGRIRPELVDPAGGNPLGLDRSDPHAVDDVVSSTLMVPEGYDVDIDLKSKDVIHSFFVPALRFKQDAVPGQMIVFRLHLIEPGTYDIACAQLCGMGHYQMNAKLRVVPDAGYRAWLQQSAPKLAHR